MKKIFQSEKYLSHLRSRAKSQAKSRRRFRAYKTQRNRFLNHLKKTDRTFAGDRTKTKNRGIPEIKAPPILSFVRNHEDVSFFIAQLRRFEEKKRPVFVVLRGVKEIDYDGITVLLSAVVRFKSRRIFFNGDVPRDANARKMLFDSGFFDYINDTFKEEDHYELKARKIYTHAKKNVDSVLGMKIIENASKVVWGKQKRCPGVQRVFLELMQNTNNHASYEGTGEKHWWLSVKHIKEEKRVTFSFIDYGVGVFNSLKNKRPGEKFYGALDNLIASYLKSIFKNNDSGMLKAIFEGELHRTATGKTYRGKGLPGIYEAYKNNEISNLAMITNNVFYNSVRNEYAPLHVGFEGTFVYWEINEKTFCLD